MAKRIYSILIGISIALGVYLYMTKDTNSTTFILVISGLTFFMFSMGIHGFLAHSLKPSEKGNLIVYPILMGALWAILFGIFLFLILPLLCPNFSLEF